jgi:hypothetical protein
MSAAVILKRSSQIRCHHLFKTFHAGPAGWDEQQLPDGTGNRPPVKTVRYVKTANKIGRGCFSLRGLQAEKRPGCNAS